MKSFALATLAASALAQTRKWEEGTGVNGTSGQWVSLSKEETMSMVPANTAIVDDLAANIEPGI